MASGSATAAVSLQVRFDTGAPADPIDDLLLSDTISDDDRASFIGPAPAGHRTD